jgi:hypothetical protein
MDAVVVHSIHLRHFLPPPPPFIQFQKANSFIWWREGEGDCMDVDGMVGAVSVPLGVVHQKEKSGGWMTAE